MEYLNRIMEANNKSQNIIDEFLQVKSLAYGDIENQPTFDEFNIDKGFKLQSKLQDLQTMVEYYERAYRDVDIMSNDELTEISDYLKVEDIKEELNRRINNLKSFIHTNHYQL